MIYIANGKQMMIVGGREIICSIAYIYCLREHGEWFKEIRAKVLNLMLII